MSADQGPAYPFSQPEEYFFEADRLINADQVNEAAALLRELLDRFPHFGKAHNHLGFIFETKYKDPEKAELHYRKCLEMAPEYPAVYLNYAVLLSSQERYQELDDLLEKALEAPGINKAKLHYERAIMRETQMQFDQAIAAYQEAIRYSFTAEDIAVYKEGIDRVRQKQALLN